MEKTLQQQYTLIKEGKGNKDHFLKSARRVFPEYITPNTDYDTAVHILKGKSILNEGVGGIATLNPNKPDWFKIFDTNLKEAVGVKDTKEYGNQNSFDKIDKETEETLSHQFDNKDDKNIDNVYGQSFLMGYYTEMKDPKNEGKTVDELKQIVLKNMTKDINYYHTETSFGVKGIGYTSEAPGAGIPKEPKGKYKSSGYGDMPKVVKEGQESLNENKDKISTISQYIRSEKDKNIKKKLIHIRYKILYKIKLSSEETKFIKDLIPSLVDESKSVKSVGSMVKPSNNEFKVGDTVIFKGTKQKITRIVDDRIYIKSEKYGLRPETWVKATDLKKAKTNETLDEAKLTMPELGGLKIGDKVKYLGKDTNGFVKGEQYEVSRKESSSTFQPTITIKNKDGKKLRTSNLSKINESLNEAKRPAVSTEIKEIEKTNEALALEAKIKSIDEAIEKRQAKLKIAESEELAEMIDKNMVKTLQKEIKELEKYKAKASKMYEKMTGSAKKEMIDEEENIMPTY